MLVRTASPDLRGLRQSYTRKEREFEVRNLSDAKNIREEYIAILSALVYEIRNFPRHQKRVTLTKGKKQSNISGDYGFVYAFFFDSDEEFFEGTRVDIVIGSNELKGTIVSLLKDSKSLLVSFDKDQGSDVPLCAITQDEASFYESLQERLEIEEGKNDKNKPKVGMNHDLADAVLGGKIKQVSKQNIVQILDDGLLNGDQLDFINKANKHTVSFLWGPPGTGKTQTLGALVGSLYKGDQKTLVCSNTNQAVDQVLLKLCRQLQKEKRQTELEEGKIVRVGKIHQPELEKEYREFVTVDGIVERKSTDINKKIAALETKRSKLDSKLNSLKEIIQINDDKNSLEEYLNDIERNKRKLDRLEKEKQANLKSWNPFKKNIEKIKKEITNLQNENTQLERKFPNAAIVIKNLTKELEKKLGHKSIEEVELEKESVTDEINSASKEISDLRKEIEEMSKKIMVEAKIVGATLTKSFLSPSQLGKFENIIIDEASMALLPSLYFTASQSETRVVISGDFRQLPPIIRSNNQIILNYLAKDIFKDSGTEDLFDQRSDQPHMGVLKSQYRMDAKICDLISDIAYNGELKTANDRVRIDLNAPPLFKDNVVLVDTSKFLPFSEKDAYGSTFNIAHALIARNIISSFMSDKSNGSVGFCSNFRAQVKLVKSMIAEEDYDKEVSIGTVHTFQGDERQTIIFDTVDSLGGNPGASPALKQESASKSNLLTVAISRAQERLIIIGNFQWIDNEIPAMGFFRKLLNRAEVNGTVINAEKIIELSSLENQLREHRVNIENLQIDPSQLKEGILKNEEFDRLFFYEIDNAKKYLCIFSGFYTSQRMASVLPRLEDARRKGVKIRIVIPPPNQNATSMSDAESLTLIKKMEDLGIVVDLREKLHDKLVLIDDDTAYFGSLNPLSFGGTTQETMFRQQSKNYAGEVHALYAINPTLAKNDPALMVEKENPPCSKCKGRTSVFQKNYSNKRLAKCIECKKGWGNFY